MHALEKDSQSYKLISPSIKKEIEKCRLRSNSTNKSVKKKMYTFEPIKLPHQNSLKEFIEKKYRKLKICISNA